MLDYFILWPMRQIVRLIARHLEYIPSYSSLKTKIMSRGER
jgi:hypothetical protein